LSSTSKIAKGTFIIDTIGAGNPMTVAVFVVKGARKTALIDCGFASSHGNVMQGLRQIGVDPSRVDYLIPTHVHLDHAGATGHLLQHMPRAKVVAHERAAPHLADPAKLVASATDMFGERLVKLYGEPLAVDKGRIEVVGDEAHLDLGGATLTTLYAPGHAPHQVSVIHQEEHLLFSADAVGMVFPSFPTLLPTTPPPSLDPVKLVATLEKLRQTDPKLLLVPHYGVRKDTDLIFDRTREKVEGWVKTVKSLKNKNLNPDQIVDEVRKEIMEETGMRPVDFPSFVNVMIRLSVLGILAYLEKESGTKARVQERESSPTRTGRGPG
jgi:glyoxylase-like metal-dependent hydrolase (beta-lactamase superfamily II)